MTCSSSMAFLVSFKGKLFENIAAMLKVAILLKDLMFINFFAQHENKLLSHLKCEVFLMIFQI